MNDDHWWSDDLDCDGIVLRMAKQCHITLIDFGFARALSPKDIDVPIESCKIWNESHLDQVLADTSHTSILDHSASLERSVLDLSEISTCISIFAFLALLISMSTSTPHFINQALSELATMQPQKFFLGSEKLPMS